MHGGHHHPMLGRHSSSCIRTMRCVATAMRRDPALSVPQLAHVGRFWVGGGGNLRGRRPFSHGPARKDV